MNKTRQLRKALENGEDLDALLSLWAPDVQRLAAGAARHVGVHRPHEFDEIESIAWTEVAKMIADERTGAARSVYSFDAHLVMRLRNAVKLWLDSEAGHAPAARMSSLLRRRRAILALTCDGMSPREAVATLSTSTRKHGSYSLADLTVQLTTSDIYDETLMIPARLDEGEMAELMMMAPEAGYMAAPFEGRALVEHVVADVADTDLDAARVVRAWLETVWVGDKTVTVVSLARRLHLPVREVEAAVALGRQLASARLERMGVHVNETPSPQLVKRS